MHLGEVSKLGQSIWIDALRRRMLTSGELRSLVEDVGLRGLTSNPTIFRDAIAGSADYDAALEDLVLQQRLSAIDLYTALVVDDIRGAADVLRPVYEASRRLDGYACLEVTPALAHDTPQTLAEARALWRQVGRDNLMVKVPGTTEGIAAVPTLIEEGINVNITLLFSESAYRKVADAYLTGLEARAARGESLDHVASVASVFVSRIDTLVDHRLEERARAAPEPERAELASLVGRVATANAKIVHQAYREIVSSPRWAALAARGARPQRPLWASMSTKDPRRRDVFYVEELIGKGTVSTLPPATLKAFLDHGRARPSLEEDLEGARRVLDALARHGISIDAIAGELLVDGVAKFAASADDLMRVLEQRRAAILRSAKAA
jgi:transaldolase/glucose-6-phosphate isomerase